MYNCMGITISCGPVHLHGHYNFMQPCKATPYIKHRQVTGPNRGLWSRVYIQLADSIATYFAWAYEHDYEQKQRTNNKTGYFAQLT